MNTSGNHSRKTVKKALSLLLVLVLLVATMTVPAFAISNNLDVEPGNTTADVSWTTGNEGSTFRVYLEMSKGGRRGPSWDDVDDYGTSDTEYTLTSLTPGQKYRVLVKESWTETRTETVNVRKVNGIWYYGSTAVPANKVYNINGRNGKYDRTIQENKTDWSNWKEFRTLSTVKYTVTLNVGNGGVVVVDGDEYTGDDNEFVVDEGDTFAASAYSNAGFDLDEFAYGTETESSNSLSFTVEDDTTVAVSFDTSDDVHGMPYYVTDGWFSGYDDNGEDISGHDPRGDILAADLSAAADKEAYVLGTDEKATVVATVTVADGDNDTQTLNEVDFYADSVKILEKGSVSTGETVSHEIVLPADLAGEADLVDTLGFTGPVVEDGFRVYTKTVAIEMVDRYNGEAGAASVYTDSADVVVKVPYAYSMNAVVAAGQEMMGTVEAAEVDTLDAVTLPATLSFGDALVLTATPASEKFAFTSWSVEAGDAVTADALVPNASVNPLEAAIIAGSATEVTYTAHFEQVKFDVAYTPNSKVEFVQTGLYGREDTFVFTAVPAARTKIEKVLMSYTDEEGQTVVEDITDVAMNDEGNMSYLVEGFTRDLLFTIESETTARRTASVTTPTTAAPEVEAAPVLVEAPAVVEEPAVVVEDEQIAESAPVVDAVAPAEVVTPATIELTEVTLPLDTPVLPKTGGLPIGLMTSLGALTTGMGMFLKRRKKNADQTETED